MNSKKYHKKLETMVKEGIKNNIYKETTDTTLPDPKLFQDFLYRNFKDYKDYKKMRCWVPEINTQLIPQSLFYCVQRQGNTKCS